MDIDLIHKLMPPERVRFVSTPEPDDIKAGVTQKMGIFPATVTLTKDGKETRHDAISFVIQNNVLGKPQTCTFKDSMQIERIIQALKKIKSQVWPDLN